MGGVRRGVGERDISMVKSMTVYEAIAATGSLSPFAGMESLAPTPMSAYNTSSMSRCHTITIEEMVVVGYTQAKLYRDYEWLTWEQIVELYGGPHKAATMTEGCFYDIIGSTVKYLVQTKLY